MAAPLTPDRLLTAMRAEGVTVVEVGNWRTHNRNHKGAWGPVHGVLVHHTVTRGSANTVRICRDGYASLPGPLCHGVITKDGHLHLVGYGRANHAGGGDPRVLSAVIAERTPPTPTRGNADGVDGNAHFYGFECENLGDGNDPWPEVQLLAIEKAAAAICRAHGWSAASVLGHKEWSQDKIDPRGFAMGAMRDRVARRLATAPGATPRPNTPTPAPVPTIPAPEEDAVPQTLSKPNPADVQLHGDAWTGLAFSGSTPAVIHGPGVRHTTSVRLLLDEATLPVETEIAGRFFLVPTDWKGDVKQRSNFLEQSAPTGGPGPVFTCEGEVPAGKTLRFEVRVSEDARLLHRQATGLYWAAP
ncbi:N-acetylmuramoyl-L-alanine amidase [Streptomyces sp. NPDC047097]|uniref:N-acetylmuramoyl-L-alanine amidase n=1 Tax=Streptomyces sp. NPDC047097 TaxID=3155260 RepID=UPI0033EFBCFE